MNVPEIRFKGFEGEWDSQLFNNIITVNSGKDYKSCNKGNIPVYGTGGYMLSVDKSLCEEDAIGIGRKGTIDAPQYLVAPFWTIDTLFYLTINKDFNKRFIYYLAKTINWKNLDESTGVPSLSKANIEKIRHFLPKFNEQQIIAHFFNSLDSQIEVTSKKITMLRQLKEASLQSMFPAEGETVPKLRFKGFKGEWERKSFKDIAERIFIHSDNISFPCVEFEDIEAGKGTLKKDIYTKSIHKRGIFFKSNDILFGKLRPYLKNILFVQFDGIAVGDFWVLRAKERSPYFLYILVNTKHYMKIANISSGSKMPRADWNIVSNSLFAVPSIQEQQVIASFFRNLDKQINIYTQRLELINRIKSACLEKMFVQP